MDRYGLELALRQYRLKPRRRSGLRQVFVLGLLVFTVVGCEVRSLYGIELVDFDEGELWKVAQRSDYSLYLLVANNPETPGITMIALSNDRPTDPSWDWEEFQSWSPDKKASVFGSFYDQKYRDLSVLHESTCPFMLKNFDQRESAQEVAYGRWLHSMPSDVIGQHPKGVSVRVPVANCDMRLMRPVGEVEELTVIVDSGRDEDAEQIRVRFRVYLVDTGIHWLF